MIRFTTAVYHLHWPAKDEPYRPTEIGYVKPLQIQIEAFQAPYRVYSDEATRQRFRIDERYSHFPDVEVIPCELGRSRFSGRLYALLEAHREERIERRLGLPDYANLTLMKLEMLLEAATRWPEECHFWIDSGLFEYFCHVDRRKEVREECYRSNFAAHLRSLADGRFLCLLGENLAENPAIHDPVNAALGLANRRVGIVAGGIFGGKGSVIDGHLRTLIELAERCIEAGIVVTEQMVMTPYFKAMPEAFSVVPFVDWQDFHNALLKIARHQPGEGN